MQMCFVWLRLIAIAIFEQQGSGCQGKCCAWGPVNRLKMTLAEGWPDRAAVVASSQLCSGFIWPDGFEWL
jgi:hypothetical protein